MFESGMTAGGFVAAPSKPATPAAPGSVTPRGAGRSVDGNCRIDGQAEVWLTTEDRILIRSAWPQYDSKYVLGKLDGSTGSTTQNAKGELL